MHDDLLFQVVDGFDANALRSLVQGRFQNSSSFRGDLHRFGNAWYFLWSGIGASLTRIVLDGALPIEVYVDQLVLADVFADDSVLENPIPLDTFGLRNGGLGDTLG